ncbi:hypothetical protein ACJ3XI_00100 [Litorimonas sp. RW-G-Af-16]|uniref:hypothetical protein n=1 Tax=Litorimonas sp. RW-G-Af-16 TaxID=3241168 RepID=UPI00390C4D45
MSFLTTGGKIGIGLALVFILYLKFGLPDLIWDEAEEDVSYSQRNPMVLDTDEIDKMLDAPVFVEGKHMRGKRIKEPTENLKAHAKINRQPLEPLGTIEDFKLQLRSANSLAGQVRKFEFVDFVASECAQTYNYPTNKQITYLRRNRKILVNYHKKKAQANGTYDPNEKIVAIPPSLSRKTQRMVRFTDNRRTDGWERAACNYVQKGLSRKRFDIQINPKWIDA